MPLNIASARDTLRPELEAQLAPAEIVDVSVTEDTDHDGDDVLRVLVTYRSKNDRLEPASVLGLIRHLRNALAHKGEGRFPLITFQTELEADEGQREAH